MGGQVGGGGRVGGQVGFERTMKFFENSKYFFFGGGGRGSGRVGEGGSSWGGSM